jgi:hypothetical protein
LQRPKELAGRASLTDEEVAELKRAAAELFNGGDGDAAFGESIYLAALRNVLGKEKEFSMPGAGSYNQFWNADREFDNRTSLIVSPEDGRLPALTSYAQKRRAAAQEREKQHAIPLYRRLEPNMQLLEYRCIEFVEEFMHGNLRRKPLVTRWEGETMILDVTRKVPPGDQLYEWYRR